MGWCPVTHLLRRDALQHQRQCQHDRFALHSRALHRGEGSLVQCLNHCVYPRDRLVAVVVGVVGVVIDG